jgi:hypothetical protein
LIIIEQSKSIAIANMKARYRKTFAGFVWVILNVYNPKLTILEGSKHKNRKLFHFSNGGSYSMDVLCSMH